MDRHGYPPGMIHPVQYLSYLNTAMRVAQQIHQTPRQMLLMLTKGRQDGYKKTVGELSTELQIKLDTSMKFLGDLEKYMQVRWCSLWANLCIFTLFSVSPSIPFAEL